MTRTATLLIALLLYATTACAANKPLSAALEWWLRSQGKFDGARVATSEITTFDKSTNALVGTGEFIITEWKVPGIALPAASEIDQIIKDYETAMKDQKTADSSLSDKLVAKLEVVGLTKQEAETVVKKIWNASR